MWPFGERAVDCCICRYERGLRPAFLSRRSVIHAIKKTNAIIPATNSTTRDTGVSVLDVVPQRTPPRSDSGVDVDRRVEVQVARRGAAAGDQHERDGVAFDALTAAAGHRELLEAGHRDRRGAP